MKGTAMNQIILPDFLAGIWAAHWWIAAVVAAVAVGLWASTTRSNGTPVQQHTAPTATEITAAAPTPVWWFADGRRKSYSGAPAAKRIVTLEVDADTAMEISKAWAAYHQVDVSRDMFRPTWAAEADQLTFEAIQALNTHLEPRSPRQFDLQSDPPPDDFPVFIYRATELSGPIKRLDITHSPLPTTQENQS